MKYSCSKESCETNEMLHFKEDDSSLNGYAVSPLGLPAKGRGAGARRWQIIIPAALKRALVRMTTGRSQIDKSTNQTLCALRGSVVNISNFDSP